jgi:uncharacterized membrane protein YtjA (UPF0391 family)
LWAASYSGALQQTTAPRAAHRWQGASGLPKLLFTCEASTAALLPRRASAATTVRELAMLHYAVVFFVIAIIAALFGFGGIAASAAGIAKILFVVFLVLALASFLFGFIKRGR